MNLIEKIKSYYDIIEKDTLNGKKLYLVYPDGKERMIPNTNITIHLAFGNEVDKDNLEKEIKTGRVLKVTGLEIYKAFYNWDEETYVQKAYGYDMRTHNYLSAVKTNIGYIENRSGYNWYELKGVQKISVFANTDQVEVGLNEYDEWVAQFSVRTDIDDYVVNRFIFNRKPNRQSIMTARMLENLLFDFMLGRVSTNFNCWECGQETHWLDVNGSFIEKVERLKERYCGC